MRSIVQIPEKPLRAIDFYDLFPCRPYVGSNDDPIAHARMSYARKVGEVMIVLIQREPRPDAPYWPGRRLLAAIDAVGWPLACVTLAHQYPQAAGAVFMVTVVAVMCAFFRLCGAIFNNHRYWFTSWWVARLFALLVLICFVMKLALWASSALQ